MQHDILKDMIIATILLFGMWTSFNIANIAKDINAIKRKMLKDNK